MAVNQISLNRIGKVRVFMLKGEKGSGDYDDTEIKEELATEIQNRESADTAIEGAIQGAFTDLSDQLDLERARIDAIVTSGTGDIIEETIWEGQAQGTGTILLLNSPVANFDYLDIYSYRQGDMPITSIPAEITSEPVVIEFPNIGSDPVHARMWASKIAVSVEASRLLISEQMSWFWEGTSNTSATLHEVTQQTQSVITDEAYIYKVVGRKLTNEAEVIDIRVGANGVTYASAGQAVRAQFEALNTSVADLQEDVTELSNNKLDKITNGTAGNITVIDNNENIADSGLSKDNLILSPQLSSHIYAEDQTPYLYRQTGGGVEVGTREYDAIVGGSVVWNQKLSNYNFASATGWGARYGTVSIADGVATVTTTSAGTVRGLLSEGSNRIAYTANDKLWLAVDIFLPVASTVAMSISGAAGKNAGTLPANQWVRQEIIWTSTTTQAAGGFAAYVSASLAQGASIKYRKAFVCNITEMFGTAVADRLYAMETAEVGSGIALLKRMFPEDTYPYTAEPSLLSAMPTAHKMVGFNLWDEEWQQAIINSSGAVVATGSNYLASKNFIPVFQNTTYYMNWNDGTGYVAEYDATQTYITMVGKAKGATYTPSSNCRYIRFYKGYSVPYQQNICINISDPARNGTYEPYEEHTYPLDSSLTLRGVAVTDANGNIKFDGDTYEPNGTVTRRYGIITLTGSETNWNKSSSYQGSFYFNMRQAGSNYKGYGKVITPDLVTVSSISDYAVGKVYPESDSVNFWFPNMESKTLAQFKEYISEHPIIMVYELATPTIETASPYDALQVCDPLGTEEYVDERSVPVPVGHVTKYPVDQVAKLDGLPSDFTTLLAYKENEFKATRTYTKYDFITINNVLYEVTATTIASGTALTVGSNITQTTVGNVLKQILSSI